MQEHLSKALNSLRQLQEDAHCQIAGYESIALGEFIVHGTLDRVIANLETVEQLLTKNDHSGNCSHSKL